MSHKFEFGIQFEDITYVYKLAARVKLEAVCFFETIETKIFLVEETKAKLEKKI